MSCNNCSAYHNMISAIKKAERETRLQTSNKTLEKQNIPIIKKYT